MDGVDAIEYILKNNIEGDIIECGCGNGNFEIEWIKRLQEKNALRHIHMFDTFAGLTEPSEKDYSVIDTPHYTMSAKEVKEEWQRNVRCETENNWCSWSVGYVKNVLEPLHYPEDYLHYIVGDVRSTLLDETNLPEKIAILRLDTDWYDSSKIELIKLFPRVVPGGVVIFDDYNHWNGQREATDEYFQEIGEYYKMVHINKTCCLIKENPKSSPPSIQELFQRYANRNTLSGTDKISTHSYGATYSVLFEQRKDTAQAILEIGVSGGYGLLCYAEYFKKATVYGIDIADNIHTSIKQHTKIKILINDAHNDSLIQSLPMFDIIIEDASHELRDQITHFIKYQHLIKPDGVYIIEDIESCNFQLLLDVLSPFATSRGFQVNSYDGRYKTNRGDDILLIFTKQT